MGEPISNDMMIIIRPTRGTETSKYPEEKITKVIPRVVASEIGRAQTKSIMDLGYGPQDSRGMDSRSLLERTTKKVKSL